MFIGGAAFETTAIPASYWAVSIILGAGSLVVGAFVRFLPDIYLEKAMVNLHILPDPHSLPRSKSKESEDEDDEENKPFACKHC